MFYLCILEDVMRFVTLWYDCNALLHMVSQQYLGEHPVTDVVLHTHT